MSIEDLNDDCLLKIIGYLDLESQLNLWRATEPTSPLKPTLSYSWSRQKGFVLGDAFDENRDLLEHFLQAIKDTVEFVSLFRFNMEQMEILQKHCFPKTQILNYWMGPRASDGNYDIEMLVKSFPNIQSLTFCEPDFVYKGEHIVKWDHILKLDARAVSYYWGPEVVKEICKKFPLQLLYISIPVCSNTNAYLEPIYNLLDLEELDIEVNFTPDVARRLLQLPKLRKLRFFELDSYELLHFIGYMRGKDVYELHCHDGLCNGCYFGAPGPVLNAILKRFEFLEKLHLEGSNFWSNPEEFWHVPSICPKLKLLYIYDIFLNYPLFALSPSAMKNALDNRSVPLTLHLYKTEQELGICQSLKHPNLKLIFEPVPVNDITFREHIELEMRPLKD